MNELNIEALEVLTPNSCSTLVIKIIKYILYTSQQIPINYELLSGFIKRREWYSDSKGEENKSIAVSSYKKMLIDQFFNKVSSVYNNFEDTFKSLESEFMENGGFKELIIMIGSTMLLPKKIFRIEIPVLKNCSCINGNSLQKNLTCVFSCMINSEYLHTYLKDHLEPMNVYILIKSASGDKPKSDCFLPKDNFRIPNVKQLVIKLKQPVKQCLCTDQNKSPLPDIRNLNTLPETEKVSDSENNSFPCWHQPKLNLKGFKDHKVDGISAFNYLKM